MATSATGSSAAGTITLVVGNVRVIGVDGVARVAKVGDKVFAREVIETGADGIIQVQLDGGRFLDVGRDSKFALSSEILAEAETGAPAVAPAATPPAGAEQDAAALQKAIAAGADPSQVAAASAAGGAPAAGGAGADGGGGTPVLIDQSSSTGDVTSGFPTQPAGITFPDIEEELLPEVEAPAVSVIVQPKPEEGVTVSGNAASVIEGTSDTGATKTVNFVITLSQAFDTDVEVTYVIQPGSALTPEDFGGELTATITILAGETEFVVPVNIVQDHFVEADQNFTIVLTDAVNATIDPSASSAVVTIINDDTAPDANPDTNWTREDSLVTAEGNVLENNPHTGAPSGNFSDDADVDLDGHDALTVIAVEGAAGNVGDTLVGQYGTLVLNADGSYTYTLNNGAAAIQRLDNNETLSESFSYTITDGFNDPSSATLTITIFGTNDVPEITVKTDGDIFAEAANAVVDEEGLVTGSNADSNKEFTTGSFKVSDTDGVDDLDFVTINGEQIAIANLVGETIEGEHGVMTITSFSGGVANFTYELTERTEDGAGPETDVFTLTVSDGTSTSDPATVTITIIDDVPTARDDSNSMTEDTVSVSGNVRDNDTQGADRIATVSGGTFEGDFGTLTLNANGSYTYTLTANLQGLDVGESVQEQFPYILTDADGDPSDATLTITITGSNDGPVAVADTNWVEEDHEVNSTATGNVLQNVSHPGDPSQSLVFADHRDTDVDIEPLTVTTTGVFVGTYGTLTLNANGTYTYVLDNGNQTVQLLADGETLTDSFDYTATDGTAAASSTLTITIFGTNDGPSVGSGSTRVSEEGLEPGIPDATGNTDTTNSATASGQVAVSDSDGDSLTVTLSEPSQALTSGGETISWSGDGTKTLTGSIDGGEVDVITITIDDDGNYTVTLLGPVDHDDTGSEDNVSITVGIVASDGETTGNGSLVVTIEDDSPVVEANAPAANSLLVDETNLALNDTADFSNLFTPDFGADGAGTVGNYTLSISASGADSGVDDVATGNSVFLFLEDGVVVGRHGTDATDAADNAIVFTVSVNNDTGVVTLDQRRAVEHDLDGPPGPAHDDPQGLGAANLIKLTATVTDRDGDTDTATANIGGAITFEDDGPALSAQAAAANELLVDETNLALNDTADFSNLFTPDFGADGAGTVGNYTLSISASGADSGVDDVATGNSVFLFLEDGVVVGRHGTDATDAADNAIVFTVSVNNDTGVVTLDQRRAVEHDLDGPPGPAHDDPQGLGAANLIKLTATVTDRDGDTDTATANIGGAITFEDDGPSLIATAATGGLVVDETYLGVNDTANFSGLFTPTYGADGEGSVGNYTLGINAGATGLVDSITGDAIVLVMNGDVVEGRVGDAGGALAFTVSVNANTGVVTLDQKRSVMHDVDGSTPAAHDDSTGLAAGNLITLTATVTDGDGDTNTATANIADAISFEDDGPSFTIVNDGNDGGTGVSITVPNPAADTTFVGQFADWDFGADTAQAVPALSDVTGDVTVVSSTVNSVVLDLEDGEGNVIATLTLNADGTDSIEVFNRPPDLVTDELLTSDVTAGGPETSKTINSTLGLTVTVTATNAGAADLVNPSTQGWAVSDNQVDEAEAIKFAFSESIERFSFVADGFTGNPSGGTIGLTIRVYYDAAETNFEDFNVNVTSGGSVQVADLPGFGDGSNLSFFAVQVLSNPAEQDGNDGFRLNNVTISQVSENPPPDLDYSFTLNLEDKDGDTTSQVFNVHLDGEASGGLVVEAIAGTSGADTLTGTTGNDVLIGGGGDDILTGGLGVDTFKWGATDGDPVSAPTDTVTDFNQNPNDKLDLSELLVGENATAGSLSAYLHFEKTGSDTTVEIKSAGSGAVDQTIVLQGIDLTSNGALNDSQIIQNLLTAGKLQTDA